MPDLTDHFAQAVEAVANYTGTDYCTCSSLRPSPCGSCRASAKSALTAALPAIRRMIAEELRAEAKRRDEEAQGVEAGCAECSEEGQAWCAAADFVSRP